MYEENGSFETNPSFNDLNSFVDPLLEIQPFDFLNYEKMPECIPDEQLRQQPKRRQEPVDVVPKLAVHPSFQIPSFHQSSNLVNRFRGSNFPLVKYEKPISEKIRESIDY